MVKVLYCNLYCCAFYFRLTSPKNIKEKTLKKNKEVVYLSCRSMVKDILFPSKRINLILYLLPHCSRHQFYRAEFVSRHCKIL